MNNRFLLPAFLAALILSPVVSAGELDDRVKELESQLKQMRTQLDTTADAVGQSHDISRTRLGGYGELHYNNLDTPSGDKKQIDFHRFVLFVGHDFNDTTRFFSEVELEHSIAGDGKKGEMELEQAYVEFDLTATTHAKGGLFLLPVGIINETHEPPVFYGVERNPVEKNIIPATWWEAGAAIGGQIGSGGLAYDLALTSGLLVDASTVSIRGGRQKAAKANAEKPAFTGRVKYSGVPGLELAATLFYQDDISQVDGDGVDSATLMETHAVWRQGALGLKALYAHWDIEGSVAKAAKKDQQSGYYVEASWRVTPRVGLFARQNSWSNKDGVDKVQQDVGVNFWPHENVVIKMDLQQQNQDAGDADGFNLGIGYQF